MSDAPNVCLRMTGEFDIADRERVQQAFDGAVASPYVVIDLSHTKYVDSSVLGAFIRLRNQRYDANPDALGFIEAGPMLRRLIEIAGISSVFPFFESLDHAAAHFGTRAADFATVDV